MSEEIRKIPGLSDAIKSVQKAGGNIPTDQAGKFAETFQNALKEIAPNPIELPDGLQRAGQSGSVAAGEGFGNVIGNLVKDVDQLHKTAEQTTQKLVSGELEDVHQVVIAMEEAQTSFRLLMEVRNKMVEAYREVMKMQL